MGSDASIYQMLNPVKPIERGPTPFEQAGQMMQIKHLLDSSQTSALQRKQLERGIADEDATAAAYREAGGDHAKVRDLLYGRGLYKQGNAAETAALARRKSVGEVDKAELEARAGKVKYLRDRLAGVEDDGAFSQWLEEAKALGAPVANVAPQRFDPAWKKQFMATQEKFLEQNTPRYERVDVGGRIEVLDMNPVTNPNIKGMQLQKTLSPGERATDARTRQANADTRERGFLTLNQPVWDSDRGVFVQRPQVGPGTQNVQQPQRAEPPPPIGSYRATSSRTPNDPTQAATQAPGVIRPAGITPKEKPLTDVQGAATAFGMRAGEAHKILTGLEDAGVTNTGITRSIASGAAGLVPFIGDKLDNAVSSSMNVLPELAGGPSAKQQQTEQARRDFVNAVLRKESGAVISPTEFENATRQYFPQPGDSKEVIAQKRTNRETAIKALGIQAGPGAGNIRQPGAAAPRPPAGIDLRNLSDTELMRELGL